jgi:hypothetical protein
LHQAPIRHLGAGFCSNLFAPNSVSQSINMLHVRILEIPGSEPEWC